MIEPSVGFQTAIRAALIANGPISFHVPPERIRAGSTRPDHFPTIILASPQTINLGRTSGGYYLSRCSLDIHVWALEDGADLARHLGGNAALALWDAPHPSPVTIVEYERPSFTYLRDPDPDRAYAHGIATAQGVIQWSV